MRHGTTNRRSRNRNGSNRRGNHQKTQVFDSNGPDVRIRGTAHQVTEKYLALAKDAASTGDRILAESYLQHAEHYQRVINSWVQDDDGDQKDRQSDNKKAEVKAGADDDLSLPASILGASAKAESSEHTAETAV